MHLRGASIGARVLTQHVPASIFKQVVLHVLAKLIMREIMGIVCECFTSHDSPSSLNQVVPYMFNLGPTQIWLNSNICLNDRTFECSLSNSNFAINSIQKCALISKVEKWCPHLEALLHVFPVQVIQVNLCLSLKNF